MAATQNRDMGSGSIPKLLAQLALPAVVAQVVNLLYNIVDRIYIGHMPEVGASALTGVGLFTPILMLITAFAMLCGSGGAPRAAIAMGRGDDDAAEKIMGNCFTLLLILAAVLTVVFYFAAPSLLVLFGASEKRCLMRWITPASISSAPFCAHRYGHEPLCHHPGLCHVQHDDHRDRRCVQHHPGPHPDFCPQYGGARCRHGDCHQPGGGHGVGAALFDRQPHQAAPERENMPLVGKVIGPCLGLGVSTFVMIATESVLSISFNSSLARYGGDIAVGAMTIITSATQLLSMPVQGLCQGAQPIMSFNFGAGKGDRVKQAFRLQFIICVAYAAAFWAACMLVPQMFASIFSTDPELVRYTAWAMRVYMAGIFSTGFQVSCQQSFVALGQAKISLFMACLRKLILLIPLIFILPLILQDKVFAVFLAEPVSDIIAATVTCSAFFIRFNKILATSQKKA